MTDEERYYATKAELLATSMVARVLLGAVARLANHDDPREFVAQFETILMEQLDHSGPLFTGTEHVDLDLREIARKTVRDITGRISWGTL